MTVVKTKVTLQSFLGLALISALLSLNGCRDPKNKPASLSPPLRITFLHLDTLAHPKGERPFIAGETAAVTIEVQGGTPPFALQLFTSLGDPRFSNASWIIERDGASLTERTIQFDTEVASGRYQLSVRVTDHDGVGAVASSMPIDVLGKTENMVPPGQEAAVYILDIARRPRSFFYQGEDLYLGTLTKSDEPVSIHIISSEGDSVYSIAARHYPERIEVSLSLPAYLRPGNYQVTIRGATTNVLGTIRIEGSSFPPLTTPTIESLALYGGKNRLQKTQTIAPNRSFRIEARVAGVKTRGTMKLHLTSAIGKKVYSESLPSLFPTDVTPKARTLYSIPWTPKDSLPYGDYTLHLTLEELGTVSTLSQTIAVQ